jgi:hypothetical protein
VRRGTRTPTVPLQPTRLPVAVIAALAGAAFFVLYAARLCPDLCLIGDSAELVTAAATWGIPHPPGYPLFTAVAHLFTAVPFHSLPWRVHLTSAVFHAGAVAAAIAATFSITGSRAAALAAGFALGISRSFLLGSLYAEVFPLNDLLFACLFAMALAVRRAPRGPSRLQALAFAGCAGLASAHHMMVALAAPAIAILATAPVFAYARASRRNRLELSAAFLGPVVLFYALVPVAAARSPWLSWGDVHDVRSFFDLVTRRDYGGIFSPVRHPTVEPGVMRLAAFRDLMVRSMGPITLIGAGLGVISAHKRSTATGVSLVVAFALTGPGFAFLNALDTTSPPALANFERFTTMCHVPAAIGFGVGVAAASAILGPSRVASTTMVLGGLVWSVLGGRKAVTVDLSRDRAPIAFAHDLVLGTPEGSLVLLTGDVPADAALYVCAVEGTCGRRIVLSPGLLSLPWKMAEVRRRYPDLAIPWSAGPALPRIHELVALGASSRPVFVYPDLLDKDPLVRSSFDVMPDRLLFRVWPGGAEEPARHAAFVASATALADGECEGCGRPGTTPEEANIARTYEAALLNHARTAMDLAAKGPQADRAHLDNLARRLEARAVMMRSFVQGGDESMSL